MAKMNRRLDSITSFRMRTPTNPQTSANFTNMAFDHSSQRAVVPSKVIGGNGGYTTMNASGRPKALSVDVGGSPEDRGTNKFTRG